ncbi:G5 domain-containing protein [Streptococcus respiraculi]
MKKQLYVAAAAVALVSVTPHLVQAEQTAPNTGIQQQDAQLKAELTSLYQKIKELSNYEVRADKKTYYQQQVGAAYYTALAKGENSTVIKLQLEAAIGKNFATFKAEVEKDYTETRNNYVTSSKNLLNPARAEKLESAVKDTTKSLDAIRALFERLYAEYAAELQANKDQAKLAAPKKQAIDEISKMNDLPNALKNKYRTMANEAKTVEEIEAAKKAAKEYIANRQKIEAKKAVAKETITKKDYLEPDERSNYLERLEQAGTETEIDTILAEADQAATTNKVIYQKREAISKEIDTLAYLSSQQKADFKNQLEDLKTEAELAAILLAAKKANIQALKDEEEEILKKGKEMLRAIKQMSELTDESLYKGQMEIWKEVGNLVGDYMQFFEKLDSEKDTNLTNKELHMRYNRLYDGIQYTEMEYIARDLNQKLQNFPDNQELRQLLKEMFYPTYATVETGSKTGGFSVFFNREIAPRQKKFLDLYRSLSGMPLTPLVPAQPIPKDDSKQSEEPGLTTRQETHEEAVPFQTITRENPELPKGEQRIVTEGEAGVRTIVEEVIMRGNQLVSRKVVSDMVTKPAVNKVVEIGTKEVSKKSGKASNKKDDNGKMPSTKQTQKLAGNGKVRRSLPKTNAVPSILSFIGVGLAGLAGLFAKNRKK